MLTTIMLLLEVSGKQRYKNIRQYDTESGTFLHIIDKGSHRTELYFEAYVAPSRFLVLITVSHVLLTEEVRQKFNPFFKDINRK